ncbi:hypothetical protein [Salipiger bermudensis]|uniref:hypothetical protein n=1 Tax=Salipiger bermudensis TaxID=344736 RepID=UPI001A8C48EE|nr:hypothetical protein [Salipiger bermudensis]MBN9675955.1 hypothetical protein [Salipiger bermudensis]
MSPRRAAANENAQDCKSPLGEFQAKVDRVVSARLEIAQRITNGEMWLLPLLKRFKAELATLEEERDLALEAAEIVNSAALHRAA